MTQREVLGWGMHAVSAVLLIAAALILWHTYTRWAGVRALVRAQVEQAGKDAANHGSDAAREAVALLPQAPAAVLQATDLTDPGSDAALARLEAKASGADRLLLEDARALGQLVRGERPSLGSASDDPDQALLAAVDTMRTSGAPVQVDLPSGATPHEASLILYEQELLARTLQARDVAHAAASAGALAVLLPNHPDAPFLHALGVALAPSFDHNQLERLASSPEHGRLLALMIDLGALVPDRRLALLAAILGVQPSTPPEAILARVVEQTKAGVGDPQRVVQACLDADCPQLTAPLLSQLSGPLQTALQRAVSNRIGDMAALALAGDPALMPRCGPFEVHHSLLCFQCSNAQGCVPHKGITIKIDDTVVPADHIHQSGTLFGVKPAHLGPSHVVVLAGTTTIADATVAL